MKALLALICVLLTGILLLEIEARQHRIQAEALKTPPAAPAPAIVNPVIATPAESKPVAVNISSAAKPPVLAQSSLFNYGGDEGQVGFEGKIYNPNAFALTNVKVRWKVYVSLSPEDAQRLERFNLEEYCGFEFAMLPPQTTYEFASSKIRRRAKNTLENLGLQLKDGAMPNLKPEITFSTAP